ncbi:hypothetical protein ES708_32864 [subsurface metagenome]
MDAHEAVAPQSAGETGSGVDAHKALSPISGGDSGLGVDAKVALLASLLRSDIGSGLEHILDRALVLTETGSGIDVSHLIKTLLLHETGSGVENSYLRIIEGIKFSSDVGAGVDASSLAAAFKRADTGEGVEAVVARALYAKEYPTGAIDLARVLTAAITGTGEMGTGVETSLKSYYQKATEVGSGIDASTLKALFSRDDVGAGAEAITLSAAMVSHETGVAVEEVLTFFRKLIDSGQGAENLHLVGYVGRRMRMIVYQKEAFSLIVYTSEVGQ